MLCVFISESAECQWAQQICDSSDVQAAKILVLLNKFKTVFLCQFLFAHAAH